MLINDNEDAVSLCVLFINKMQLVEFVQIMFFHAL